MDTFRYNGFEPIVLPLRVVALPAGQLDALQDPHPTKSRIQLACPAHSRRTRFWRAGALFTVFRPNY